MIRRLAPWLTLGVLIACTAGQDSETLAREEALTRARAAAAAPSANDGDDGIKTQRMPVDTGECIVHCTDYNCTAKCGCGPYKCTGPIVCVPLPGGSCP
jgi:hypothetical protein